MSDLGERLAQDDARLTCRNCGSAGTRPFFAIDDIPVHSVLLMHTREQALDYPRGDLLLAHCGACGFLQNALFDPRHNDYSTEYEETQGFSGVFNAFQDRLCTWLADEHGVRDKSVLEIGCGKGEFLVRLCEIGDNRGVGVDPSYRAERTDSPAAERIEFLVDLYSEEYAHLGGDCVVCRHTLEHIAPTEEFLRMVRATLGDRTDTVVFFELPETLRILEEGAFWDVYYEHCSYFTPGSLARLFRSAGFEIDELRLDYDDQYILLVAHPVAAASAAELPLEHDLGAISEGVARFEEEGPAAIRGWRGQVRRLVADGGRVAVWGAGSKAVAFLTTTKLDGEISAVVDINPHKQGRFLPGTGHEVSAPARLVDVRPTHVIVMNPIYCDEIRSDLEALGVEAELLPVGEPPERCAT